MFCKAKSAKKKKWRGEVGEKRPLNGTSKVNRQTHGQTDGQTDKQTDGHFDLQKASAQRADDLKI
jgi:hypothetical protein